MSVMQKIEGWKIVFAFLILLGLLAIAGYVSGWLALGLWLGADVLAFALKAFSGGVKFGRPGYNAALFLIGGPLATGKFLAKLVVSGRRFGRHEGRATAS